LTQTVHLALVALGGGISDRMGEGISRSGLQHFPAAKAREDFQSLSDWNPKNFCRNQIQVSLNISRCGDFRQSHHRRVERQIVLSPVAAAVEPRMSDVRSW